MNAIFSKIDLELLRNAVDGRIAFYLLDPNITEDNRKIAVRRYNQLKVKITDLINEQPTLLGACN